MHETPTTHPPTQKETPMHQKTHMQQQQQKTPTPMGTMVGRSPHLPTFVWVGWVFVYFSSTSCFHCTSCFCCTRCFHCMSCFHCHFCCSFDRCLHPPHPIHPVVVQPIPISRLRCVQCCSCCLHGVK